MNTSLMRLEPWAEGGLDLLRLTNAPEMTEHLGGPESEEQLISRHERYLDLKGKEQMCQIVLLPEGEMLGSTGYWETAWQGETVYETGYGILPRFQGRGVVAGVVAGVMEKTATQQKHRYLAAFPSVHHAASNAVCRRVKVKGPCERRCLRRASAPGETGEGLVG
jgi:RimJ/RimL family protein N-acetyltransferase